jgi:hypothetical protein
MSRPDAGPASSGLVDIRKSPGFGLAARRDARHKVAVQNGPSKGCSLPLTTMSRQENSPCQEVRRNEGFRVSSCES